MTYSEERRPRVVFLLGAGASVEAGAPTVRDLVGRFSDHLKEHGPKDVADAFEELSAILARFRPVDEGRVIVDIELLLTAITQLIERDDYPLAAFASQWKAFVKKREKLLPDLRDALQAHIRSECTVVASEVEYLRPLGDFLRQFGPLDIFTLNYDFSVELALEKEGHRYTDGFDMYWNPGLFESGEYLARIFKLHGSLLWFETGGVPRRLVKVPVRTNGELPKVFSGEGVSHNVIYPVLTKEQHVEPYATMMGYLRRSLSEAQILVCIGCSFRDTYVKQVVIERMLQNRRMRLLIVDPEAKEVIEVSDKMVDPRWTFDSVIGRVSLFPRRASKAFASRILLQRASQVAQLGELEERHVSAALQSGRSQSDSLAYYDALAGLRSLNELIEAFGQRAVGEALQENALENIANRSLQEFGAHAPPALWLAHEGHSVRIRRAAATWLRDQVKAAYQDVCWVRGRRQMVYRKGASAPGALLAISSMSEEDRLSFSDERWGLLADACDALESWIEMGSAGPCSAVTKLAGQLSLRLNVVLGYFDELMNSTVGHIEIQLPFGKVVAPADGTAMERIGREFNPEGQPIVLEEILPPRILPPPARR